MRLLLVISALGPGGAQRQLAEMANYWARKRQAVTLLSLSALAAEPFYRLEPHVRYLPLRVLGNAKSFVAALRESGRAAAAVRCVIKSTAPDAVLSFIDQVNILTLAATRGLGIPVVVSERTDPRRHKIGHRWRILRKLVYPVASKIVVQREEYKEGLPAAARTRCVVIPNFVCPPAGEEPSRVPSRRDRKIVAMGRLSREKGFDLLLRAFANLPLETERWPLEIWGGGPMLGELEALASRLGVAAQVRFCGLTQEPHRILASADIFVLSSRYEGFPNVLLEAMSVGVPVISFDCPSGPRAIIRDGVDGLLVPPEDVEMLAQTIRRLIENPGERVRLASRAVEVNQRFSIERVMGQWESLLSSASAN